MTHPRPNSLDAFFMPFSMNKHFKAAPRLLTKAKGMYYESADGHKMLDAIGGLWCVNAGHGASRVVEAVQKQVAELDYAPTFHLGHPLAFELAHRLAKMAPADLDHVFYTSSGSEAVDTALKLALAYHRQKGQGQRQRFIGRERAYHGVGFGGISVGGISPNRKMFGLGLPGIDHLPHTYSRADMAFSHSQPQWGAHLADELERLVQLHDASTIAAVIVEPVAGSTGVLVPPVGYLERLRAICDKHGLLLIFDEVITGFGRVGASFAAEKFAVTPDMITVAKGITNGTVPMGAVLLRRGLYEAFMQGPETQIDFFHGYTYSGHPLACAAAMATLDTYEQEGLFARADNLAPYWQSAIHSLRDARHVVDIRNIGLVGAIELDPRIFAAGTTGLTRAYEAFLKMWERDIVIRPTAEILVFSPSLIIEKAEIDRIFTELRAVLASID